jgi:quinol-cytochrome oxidoreductase complex cytochrome b subunit
MSDQSKKNNSSIEQKRLPFWPHYVLSELIAWYVILGLLVTLSAVIPAGLEDRANAMLTPEHVKPEWYFLSIYQFLKVAAVFNFLGADMPRLLGIVIPGILIAMLFFLPFLDRAPKRVARQRPVMLAVVVLVLLVIIGLTVWGQYS